MDKIQLYDKTFRMFIPNAEIEKAIDAVAERINRDYANLPGTTALLCVLNGSILFTAELMKRLTFNAELLTLKLSSYEGTVSSGSVREVSKLTGDVRGKNVLIIEDIVDTGTTIEALHQKMQDEGAADIRICTLLLKPEVYRKDIQLDYVAMEIPNRFIVGFGLDYDELGRNCKDIYVLDD